MKKVCLCLAFVLASVCILCSCSDLPAPSTSETVNPSVDVTFGKSGKIAERVLIKRKKFPELSFGERFAKIL